MVNKAKNARKAYLGLNHSEETKLKIGAAQLGALNHNFGNKYNREQCELISKRNKGYKHTPESIAKIAASKLGKSLTSEHKEKLSIYRTGKLHSEESRAKMSVLKKGRVFTDEHKEKIRLANKLVKRCKIKEVIAAGNSYPTIASASRDLKMTIMMLRRRLQSDNPLYSNYKIVFV